MPLLSRELLGLAESSGPDAPKYEVSTSMGRRGDNDGLMAAHSVGVLAPDPCPARVVSIRGRPAPLEAMEDPRFRVAGDNMGEDGSLEP